MAEDDYDTGKDKNVLHNRAGGVRMRIEPEYPPVNRLRHNVSNILLALDNYDLMKSGRWPVQEIVGARSRLRSRYPAARDFIDEILRRLRWCGRDGRLVERYYIEYRAYSHQERLRLCLSFINDFNRFKWKEDDFWRSVRTAIRYIAKVAPRRTRTGEIISYRSWKNHRNPYVTAVKTDTIEKP